MFTTNYYVCSFCHERARLTTYATDRVELERERGERFTVHCGQCHKAGSLHVNDVSARPNPVVTALGGLAGVAATVALWNLGFIAFASGAVPVIIYQAQATSAQTFNGYKIGGGK